MNGQMGGPVRGQMMSCQAPMARHPSREQLIDYLMLKVSHGQQPQGPPPPRADHDTLQQEVGWGNGWRVTVQQSSLSLHLESYRVFSPQLQTSFIIKTLIN